MITYKPSSEAQRLFEQDSRNHDRLQDYYAKQQRILAEMIPLAPVKFIIRRQAR